MNGLAAAVESGSTRARRLAPAALLLGPLVLLMLVAAIAIRSTEPSLPGTRLDGRVSPDFTLHDARGVTFSLADARGQPVVLSFMYSNCPDVCRLTAAGLKQTVDLLGQDADRAHFVAVTVDPVGDDLTSTRRFLNRYHLESRMLYLTGPEKALSNVWRDYFLFVGESSPRPGELGLDAHTDVLYLIDREGRQRAILRSDFDPDELAAGVRQLQAEGTLREILWLGA